MGSWTVVVVSTFKPYLFLHLCLYECGDEKGRTGHERGCGESEGSTSIGDDPDGREGGRSSCVWCSLRNELGGREVIGGILQSGVDERTTGRRR